MRSSPGTLQNHYLKKDVDLMDDEEPEPPPIKKPVAKNTGGRGGKSKSS